MPTAYPLEHVAALELLFRHLPPEEVLARIVTALPLVGEAEAHGLRLLVARGDNGLRAAMMTQALPGGTGLVWPPQGDADAEDALLGEAQTWLQESAVRIVQALLMPEEVPTAAPLLRAGFTHTTKLWYFRHRLTEVSSVGTLSFQSYREADRDAFHRTLRRSY